MKAKITRVRGKEFCTLEVELRAGQNDSGPELSICGVHGDVMPRSNAKKRALEYWKSHFDDDPGQIIDMNKRCGTRFTSATSAARYVLSQDGEFHGLDVMDDDGKAVMIGHSFGQITDTIVRFFPEAAPYMRWHLNNMHAGCEHQDALGWGHGRTIALDRMSATGVQVDALDARLRYAWEEERERARAKILAALALDTTSYLHGRASSLSVSDVEGLAWWASHGGHAVSSAFSVPRPLMARVEEIVAADVAAKIGECPTFEAEIFKDSIGAPCPECGYRYGTAWLARALPQDVIAWAEGLPGSLVKKEETVQP